MPDVDELPPFRACTGAAPYVFVSYAHKDARFVFPDIATLHDAGFRIWYDEGIDPGNEWSEEIAKALIGASHFLIFLSANAVNSRNVRREVNLALARDKTVLVIYIEDTVLPPGLELGISDIQAIMRYRMSKATYLQKLLAALPQALKQDAGIATSRAGTGEAGADTLSAGAPAASRAVPTPVSAGQVFSQAGTRATPSAPPASAPAGMGPLEAALGEVQIQQGQMGVSDKNSALVWGKLQAQVNVADLIDQLCRAVGDVANDWHRRVALLTFLNYALRTTTGKAQAGAILDAVQGFFACGGYEERMAFYMLKEAPIANKQRWQRLIHAMSFAANDWLSAIVEALPKCTAPTDLDETTEAILDVLDRSSNASVTHAAIDALKQLGSRRCLGRLRDMIEQRELDVSSRIAEVLAEWGDVEAVPQIRAAIANNLDTARWEVSSLLVALSRLSPGEVPTVVCPLLAKGNPMIVASTFRSFVMHRVFDPALRETASLLVSQSSATDIVSACTKYVEASDKSNPDYSRMR